MHNMIKVYPQLFTTHSKSRVNRLILCIENAEMQMGFFNNTNSYILSLTLLPGNDQPLSFEKLAKIHILTQR